MNLKQNFVQFVCCSRLRSDEQLFPSLELVFFVLSLFVVKLSKDLFDHNILVVPIVYLASLLLAKSCIVLTTGFKSRKLSSIYCKCILLHWLISLFDAYHLSCTQVISILVPVITTCRSTVFLLWIKFVNHFGEVI